MGSRLEFRGLVWFEFGFGVLGLNLAWDCDWILEYEVVFCFGVGFRFWVLVGFGVGLGLCLSWFVLGFGFGLSFWLEFGFGLGFFEVLV